MSKAYDELNDIPDNLLGLYGQPQRSNTAMTMPDSVWINNGDNQQTWLHSCNKHHTQHMIRADIADELARALEACPGSIGRKALERYREALAD